MRKVESVLGSAIDGIIQWIDQNVQDVVRGVQNTGQRVVNWLKDGHVALVIPDNIKNYNDDKGPKIAHAGGVSFGSSDNKHITDGFFNGWKNKVKFFIIK